MLEQGERVATPMGNGAVVYVRMLAPDFSQIGAVSVKLDDKMHVGVLFDPAEVIPIPEGTQVKACKLAGTARVWFKSVKNGAVVYVCMRRDSRGRLRAYRIASDSPSGLQGWRLDELDLCIWCAVTGTVYRTPQAAAADFEARAEP